MSNVARTPELTRDGARNPQSDLEPRTYRGTDLDELLPKIREELGPDAIVLRQRDGLDGGIGGFFQRRCVEVVARRAAPRVNLYDEGGPVMPPVPEPPAPAIQEIMRVAAPFVEQLQAAAAQAEPEIAPEEPSVASWAEPEHEPEPQPQYEPAGHEPEPAPEPEPPVLVAEIVGGTLAHAVPFAPKRALKHLVRDAFASRIPVLSPAAPGARTIAFVGSGGSGKTLCATRVAAAYGARGDVRVTLLELAAGQLPEPVAGGGITVVDTPAVSPAAAADTRALARQLRRLGGCEVHVAVPATLSASAVRRLLDGLGTLKPAAIALTHLDEVDHAGPVIDEAIARGIALSYCSDADTIVLADPAALAARVLA
jgi:flagellar biosynthesis protein FlhF